MAQLILDLTGKGGLTPRFYGDIEDTTQRPQLRYLGGDDQMAYGVYNPLRRYGYMCPATISKVALTGTISAATTCGIFDPITSEVYFAGGRYIQSLSGLQDTSLTQKLDLGAVGTMNITDLEIYQINGVRKLFYSYTRANFTGLAVTGTANNGAGLIRITTDANPLKAGDTVTIQNVGGTTEANGNNWAITVISSTQFDLVGSTYANAWTSGGTVNETGTQPNGEIGIATIAFATEDVDWLSTAPVGAFNTSGVGTFMRVATDGYMYVFDRNEVHKIDGTTAGGTNGTVSPSIIIFDIDYRIKDAIDYRNNMYIAIDKTQSNRGDGSIGCFNSKSSGIYIWDRLTNEVKMRDFISIRGVREILNLWISPNDELMCMVITDTRSIQICKFNGTKFATVHELGYNSFPRYLDSLALISSLSCWLGNDNTIYGYGSPVYGEKEGLFMLSKPSITSAGILLSGAFDEDNSLIRMGAYFSHTVTSTPTISRWSPNGVGTIWATAQKANQGDIFTLVKFLPKMSTVSHLDIYCAKGTGGISPDVTLKIYFNQGTTASITKTITTADISKGYFHVELNKPFVNAIQLEFEYNTTTTLSSLDDFMPNFAILNYEPTNTTR